MRCLMQKFFQKKIFSFHFHLFIFVIISFLQTLGLALNPIRAILQQQPRVLLSSVHSTATTTTTQNTSALVNDNQQQLQQTDEPDKLYKKLEIELKGIDPAVLKSYSWFATNAAQHLGIEVGKW